MRPNCHNTLCPIPSLSGWTGNSATLPVTRTGTPFPADGRITVPSARPLQEPDDGHRGRITRISDANPDLVRFLAAEAINLDATVQILERRPFGGPLTVRVGDADSIRIFYFGQELTAALWIETQEIRVGCRLPDALGS